MDYYTRKIMRKSKQKEEYAINIPISIVRELEFYDCKVTIKVKGRTMMVTKVGEKMDNSDNNDVILI